MSVVVSITRSLYLEKISRCPQLLESSGQRNNTKPGFGAIFLSKLRRGAILVSFLLGLLTFNYISGTWHYKMFFSFKYDLLSSLENVKYSEVFFWLLFLPDIIGEKMLMSLSFWNCVNTPNRCRGNMVSVYISLGLLFFFAFGEEISSFVFFTLPLIDAISYSPWEILHDNCFQLDCVSGFKSEWCGRSCPLLCLKCYPKASIFFFLESYFCPPHSVFKF